MLACLAACAAGTTVIRGAAELRVKESDRLAAVHGNLTALGVVSREARDGLEIEGTAARLAGRVFSAGDHRIAMSFGILGALGRNDVRVADPGCVRVSYPGFWAELSRIAGMAEGS
jgi:3-phosphoshikimate 1-carboxyvinyltransferase